MIEAKKSPTIGFTGNVIYLKSTLTDSSADSYLVANGDAYNERVLAGKLNSFSSIDVYNNKAKQYFQRDFFFNNPRIEAVAEPTSFSLLGLTALAAVTGYCLRVREGFTHLTPQNSNRPGVASQPRGVFFFPLSPLLLRSPLASIAAYTN